jgi:hypothetical protein
MPCAKANMTRKQTFFCAAKFGNQTTAITKSYRKNSGVVLPFL